MMSAKCQLQTLVPIIEPRGVKRHVGSYAEAGLLLVRGAGARSC